MQWVRTTDDTFCIAVLGDFLGEQVGSAGPQDVTWNPHRATPDSVMNLVGLHPWLRASLDPGGVSEEVEVTSLQSFDPGELFQKLALFGPLREAREAAKTGRLEGTPPSQGTPPPQGAPEAPGGDEGGGSNLLDAILEVSQPKMDIPAPGTSEEIEAFVREVVRPHLVRDDADAKTRVAAVDEAISRKVSDLLHMESFQRLEAIWRSLVFLLSRVDTTGKVRVYLVHLPRRELEEDLLQNSDPLRSKLFDLLSSPRLGAPGRKWAVVAGAYEFGGGAEEIGLLQRIAGIARVAEVPWISAIDPKRNRGGEPSDQSFERWFSDPPEGWERLKQSPEAAWLGLTFPRFLLREGYGEGSRRVRDFTFQEEIGSVEHLLWGEGPFLAAALMAQGFVTGGWGFRPEHHLDLEGMPLGNLREGEGISSTSVEVSLSPREARQLMEMGIIPLLGFPERAGVRLGGIHPVAGPIASLAAWWRSSSEP